MNYYITQEQYEQLKEMGNNLEDIETIEDFHKLIEQVGNQRASDLV
jgi:hypothetical protein